MPIAAREKQIQKDIPRPGVLRPHLIMACRIYGDLDQAAAH